MSNKKCGPLLIIDGSYMLHRNLHVSNLWELNNGIQRTGGVFGFLRSLGSVINSAPAGFYPVVCWDKGLSPARLDVFPNYKWHKDREFESKLISDATEMLRGNNLKGDVTQDYMDQVKLKMKELSEMKETIPASPDDDYLYQYSTQRNMIIEILAHLGVASVLVNGWEGDDLMTLLTRMSTESIIVTDDSDLQQLISDNIKVMKVLKGVSFVTLDDIKNEGYRDARDVAKVKAITGDSSDNVPQIVPRLGYKTAQVIVKVINEFNDNPDEYLKALQVRFSNKTVIQEFVKCHNDYLRNLKLVDLSYVPDDISVINHIYNILFSELRVNYLGAISKLGQLQIAQVPVDIIITYSVSSYSSSIKDIVN